MIAEFVPNVSKYEEIKADAQEAVYRGAHSTSYANPDHAPDKSSIDRLVNDVEKQ
jgi:SYF2 splicing factor